MVQIENEPSAKNLIQITQTQPCGKVNPRDIPTLLNLRSSYSVTRPTMRSLQDSQYTNIVHSTLNDVQGDLIINNEGHSRSNKGS
jgi:hypothetical protein